MKCKYYIIIYFVDLYNIAKVSDFRNSVICEYIVCTISCLAMIKFIFIQKYHLLTDDHYTNKNSM